MSGQSVPALDYSLKTWIFLKWVWSRGKGRGSLWVGRGSPLLWDSQREPCVGVVAGCLVGQLGPGLPGLVWAWLGTQPQAAL